jgi:hypothetical protein
MHPTGLVAAGEPLEDCPARGIGEGRESGTGLVDGHVVLTLLVEQPLS